MAYKLRPLDFLEIVEYLKKEFDTVATGGPGNRLVINGKIITGLLFYPETQILGSKRDLCYALVKEAKIQLGMQMKFKDLSIGSYFKLDNEGFGDHVFRKVMDDGKEKYEYAIIGIDRHPLNISPDVMVYLTKVPFDTMKEEDTALSYGKTIKLKNVPDGSLFTFPHAYNSTWKKLTTTDNHDMVYARELFDANNSSSPVDPEAEVYLVDKQRFIEVSKLFKDIGDDEFFRVKDKPGIWQILIPSKKIKYVVRIDLPNTSAQTIHPNTDVCICLPDADPKVIYMGKKGSHTVNNGSNTPNDLGIFPPTTDGKLSDKLDKICDEFNVDMFVCENIKNIVMDHISSAKLEAEIQEYPITDDEEANKKRFYAYFKNSFLRGVGECGATAAEAFNELIISLKVKIAYDNNLDVISVIHSTSPKQSSYGVSEIDKILAKHPNINKIELIDKGKPINIDGKYYVTEKYNNIDSLFMKGGNIYLLHDGSGGFSVRPKSSSGIRFGLISDQHFLLKLDDNISYRRIVESERNRIWDGDADKNKYNIIDVTGSGALGYITDDTMVYPFGWD